MSIQIDDELRDTLRWFRLPELDDCEDRIEWLVQILRGVPIQPRGMRDPALGGAIVQMVNHGLPRVLEYAASVALGIPEVVDLGLPGLFLEIRDRNPQLLKLPEELISRIENARRNLELLRLSVCSPPSNEDPTAGAAVDTAGYSVPAFCDLVGVSSGTLNKYAKLAGMDTPGVGQKNFTYGRRDAETILAHGSKIATDMPTRKKFQEALTAMKKTAGKSHVNQK
ncbi:MAG: hypothetical protein GY842_19045 [bacterium]|nr:hypothetical protein [bacterium]